MLQEIYEQPEVLRTCLQTYRPTDLPLLPPSLITDLEQIHILACGSSWHAALVAQHWLEQVAGIPTRVRAATEFIAAPLPLTPNTLTIAVTQSGETADTLAAIALEKERRIAQPAPQQPRLLGITNQPNSTLAAHVDHTLPTLAGSEVGVAATKTFLAQLLVFCCLALDLAQQRSVVDPQWLQGLLMGLQALPDQITALLQQQDAALPQLARTLAGAEHCILLGQGINRAIALEGALKLKETSYLHAEGYGAGEFLHGPMALLDAHIPVVAIAPAGKSYASVLAALNKIKPSGAPVTQITTANAPISSPEFADPIVLPAIEELLSPLLTVIPLQLLAYYRAVYQGLDVDRPRHITKTLI